MDIDSQWLSANTKEELRRFDEYIIIFRFGLKVYDRSRNFHVYF